MLWSQGESKLDQTRLVYGVCHILSSYVTSDLMKKAVPLRYHVMLVRWYVCCCCLHPTPYPLHCTELHLRIGCVVRIALSRASSAIGLELARLLYLDGFSLILISRYCTILPRIA
jgi:hypothetical protein